MELLKPYIPSLLPSLTEEVGKCLTWAEKGVTSIPGWSLGRHLSHLSVDEGPASYTALLPWWVLLSGPSSTLPPCSHSSPLSSLSCYLDIAAPTSLFLFPTHLPPSPVCTGTLDPACLLADGIRGPEPWFFSSQRGLWRWSSPVCPFCRRNWGIVIHSNNSVLPVTSCVTSNKSWHFWGDSANAFIILMFPQETIKRVSC